jgi:hypothetical protein
MFACAPLVSFEFSHPLLFLFLQHFFRDSVNVYAL